MSAPLPPLNALRAFEATARHLSFSRAATELHVTPAALSHQIKGLEDFLGVRLFERKARSIALTDAGRQLYPGLHSAFLQIRQAVASLERLQNDRVLVISAPPGFTAKWLAPRLYRFLIANPDIDARISSSMTIVDFGADGVDVAVRNTRGPFDGLVVDKLIDIHMLPVVSPRYLDQIGALTAPADLLKATLIHDDSLLGLADIPTWADWFRAAGFDHPQLDRGLRFNSADHALDAAVEGAGVLLGHRTLAYDDLRTGRLVAPFDITLKTGRAFHFVCPIGSEARPKVAAFRTWIGAEMAAMNAALATADGIMPPARTTPTA